MAIKVFILGGGDLASGVALRLFRSGLNVIITELPEPLMVRRLVSFGEAMYRGEFSVEGVTSQKVETPTEFFQVLSQRKIPVIYLPPEKLVEVIQQEAPLILVDARMRKRPPEYDKSIAALVIGLGPGFSAGVNCHAVVETQRGHWLGRVIWQGEASGDTGIPERVQHYDAERVLRSPAEGVLDVAVEIGDHLEAGQIVAHVNGTPVMAPFKGVLRGMMHTGLRVSRRMKIGDVDPRDDPQYCALVSDKSLAMGGAVLEAILSRGELRSMLWK